MTEPQPTPGTSSEGTIERSFSCCVCNAEFPSLNRLKNHNKSTGHSKTADGQLNNSNVVLPLKRSNEQSPESSCKKRHLQCRKCKKTFPSHQELYVHRNEDHHQAEDRVASFQSVPWRGEENAPWSNQDGLVDEKMKNIYNQHRHLILKQRRTELTNTIRYNFPVTNDISVEDFVEQIEHIYSENVNAFKINLSFGLILANVETGDLRYFAPYSNEQLFHLPLLISNRGSMESFERRLRELDIIHYIMR